jgi:hypothetical protein
MQKHPESHSIAAGTYGLCPRCGGFLHTLVYGQVDGQPGLWTKLDGHLVAGVDYRYACERCHQGVAGHGPTGGPVDRLPWPNWRAYQWALLLQLDAAVGRLDPEAEGLAVPQGWCSFRFGPRRKALPAGALLRLWMLDPKSRPPCPDCGGPGRAHSMGGSAERGGYACRCLHCGLDIFSPVGGFHAVERRLSHSLEGTPWYVNGGRLGLTVAADGVALGQALQLGGWEGEMEPGPAPWAGEEPEAAVGGAPAA